MSVRLYVCLSVCMSVRQVYGETRFSPSLIKIFLCRFVLHIGIYSAIILSVGVSVRLQKAEMLNIKKADLKTDITKLTDYTKLVCDNDSNNREISLFVFFVHCIIFDFLTFCFFSNASLLMDVVILDFLQLIKIT